jgi:hypothetical protein
MRPLSVFDQAALSSSSYRGHLERIKHALSSQSKFLSSLRWRITPEHNKEKANPDKKRKR